MDHLCHFAIFRHSEVKRKQKRTNVNQIPMYAYYGILQTQVEHDHCHYMIIVRQNTVPTHLPLQT